MLLKWFYLAAAILPILGIAYHYETGMSKASQKQIFLFSSLAIANYSYAMGCFANTMEGVIIANQLYNFGSVIANFFMIMVVSELCGIKVNKWIQRLIFAYCVVIIFFVSTCTNFTLYYSEIGYGLYHGVTYMAKKYGPLHILLLILVFGSNLYFVAAAMLAVYRNYKISVKTAILIILMFTVTTISYAFTRILHIPIDILPFTNVINMVLLIYIFRRSNMYDMTANVLNIYEKKSGYGCISFDKNRRYMGCNDFALKLYPSLKKVAIDSMIPKSDYRLNKEIVSWLDKWINGSKSEFIAEYDGITAICSMQTLTAGKRDIGYLIELHDATNQKKYINLLKNYSKELEGQVEHKNEKLLEMQDSIITGIASLVESRDNSTGNHIRRTSEEVKIFVKKLKAHEEFAGYSESFYSNVAKAATLHDLGKIAVDDKVLRKPGIFDGDDYEQMKKHCKEGAKIVAEVLKDVDDEEFKTTAINIAHYHHERWDGTGYPSGLKEKEIPVEARIMALADVFDALVSKRCYKEAYSFDEAFKIIEENLGTHFDPVLGKIFMECRPELETLYSVNALAE